MMCEESHPPGKKREASPEKKRTTRHRGDGWKRGRVGKSTEVPDRGCDEAERKKNLTVPKEQIAGKRERPPPEKMKKRIAFGRRPAEKQGSDQNANTKGGQEKMSPRKKVWERLR